MPVTSVPPADSPAASLSSIFFSSVSVSLTSGPPLSAPSGGKQPWAELFDRAGPVRVHVCLLFFFFF
jgi:hypothetical protein